MVRVVVAVVLEKAATEILVEMLTDLNGHPLSARHEGLVVKAPAEITIPRRLITIA